ncbi:hypothetical protein ABBQ32_003317 [Trebouxia sp. C0010 RCD-2024]
MQDCNALQAMPALAQGAAAEDISHDLPLTDVSPSSLVDVVTPLESQEDVQTTLGTQQDHAAVYSPGPDTIPEQTPNQIAAVSVSGSTGSAAASKALAVRQSPSKHAKPEKQQLASAKSGKETVSLGATFPCSGEEEGTEDVPNARPRFDGKFTFTAAPHVPMAKKLQRKNFSHSEARLREIKRENKMMVDRLAHVAPSQSQTPLPPVPVASAGVNRRKAADSINEQNYAIFRRLQAVQPSKEIRREQLELDFKANQQYVQNASHHRSATPTSGRVEFA